MTPLDSAQAIVNQLAGVTSSLTVSNAISALNDLLLEQKAAVSEARKLVNQAKDAEDAVKLDYKKIENLLDRAKRQRQELRDERYHAGV
jgi:hypothetical protein